MNAVQTIEFVRDALVKQGRPSLTGRGNCLYRHPSGRKCAIGHLIDDSKYTARLDEVHLGYSVDGIYNLYPHIFKHIKPSHMTSEKALELLEELQNMHDFAPEDEVKFPEYIKSEAEILIKKWSQP